MTGWTHRTDASGDIFTSAGLNVTVAAQPWPKPPSQMERYFAPRCPRRDQLCGAGRQAADPDERVGDGAHTVSGEATFKVGASFRRHPDTHYYGLGQYQDGVLDLRGRTIDCRHDYDRPGGESVCVPFMVTDKGYAILWDNPSARPSRRG
jgi:alpha-D-xyloside xylohydrolase